MWCSPGTTRLESGLTQPQRHAHAQSGGQQTVGSTGDNVRVEHILPHYRQSLLGHNVREDENRAEILAPSQVDAGDEKGENTAKQNGRHTGICLQQYYVQKQ